MRFDFSGSNWYWKTLANMARGTSVEGWYPGFLTLDIPFPSHLALAIALLLVNALGIFLANRSTRLASRGVAQDMADIGWNICWPR